MSAFAPGSDLHACAALVDKGDPDRFSAAMAAPVKARRVLFPLYAFNVEVARAPWVTEEAMIAEMRLQWWRDALEEIAGGGKVRRHEVTTPLARVLTPELAQMLDEAVAARRWDIYRDPFEDFAHLDAYIDQTAGHVMWAAVAALGGGASQTDVRALAWAAGLANYLRAIPELEARGRVPLLDGTPEGVRLLAERGMARLSVVQIDNIPERARPALLPAFGARAVLGQALKDPAAVAEGRLALTGLRRPWRLFRATQGVY